MDKKVKNFIREIKKISFPKNGKAQVKESVLFYMKQRPLPNISEKKSTVGYLALFLKPISRLAPTAALVLTLTTAGASLAAEGALPGDFLHLVKVNFNEKVKDVLAVTPEAKAQRAISKVDRRLTEIEKLAAQNKLTSAVFEKAEANFEKNISSARKIAEKLEEKESPKASLNVQAALEAVLDAHLPPVEAKELKAAEAVREAAENEASLEKIAEAENFLKKKEDKISNNLLIQAQDILTKAKEDVSDGDFRQAMRSAQQAKKMAEISSSIRELKLDNENKELRLEKSNRRSNDEDEDENKGGDRGKSRDGDEDEKGKGGSKGKD